MHQADEQGEAAAEAQSGVQAEAEAVARGLYPINALRNLALSQARTELVFLLDVDFVPSAGLLRDLTRQPALLSHLAANKAALVVPAFEVSPRHRLPAQQAALAALAASSPPQASGFHTGHFPVGHAPTDFARWFTSARPYEVAYEESYEPYVVASKRWLPAYDERFRGYGLNKVSHLYAVAAQGARFLVMPSHFVAAHEHPKSSSWQTIYGQNAEVVQRMRLAALWRRFKAELPPLPAPPASAKASTSGVASSQSTASSWMHSATKRPLPSTDEAGDASAGTAIEPSDRAKAARLTPLPPLPRRTGHLGQHQASRRVLCQA